MTKRKKRTSHLRRTTPRTQANEITRKQSSTKLAGTGQGFETSTQTSPSEIDEQNRLQTNFMESHKHIRNHVVMGNHPEEELEITEEFRVSHFALDEYVTLDWKHYLEIQRLMRTIREYAQDRSRRRPLNIIMQADPGSGKSHFIKCLGRKMSRQGISDVTVNMASFQGVDDFLQPLEAIRNLKVVDKLPLLFLDEFDSNQNNYALLLPLLWDGELSVGHRQLRVGKVVIILAGSGSQIADVMKASKEMRRGSVTGTGKLRDLLSRINGGELSIPDLDEVDNDNNRDRRVDKVCLTIALLKQRFGRKLERAPWAFLRFVAQTKFHYGVRSISHLIDLIPSKHSEIDTLHIDDLSLPLDEVDALKSSSLAYHVIADVGPAAVIQTWKKLKETTAIAVRFQPAFLWEDLFKGFITF